MRVNFLDAVQRRVAVSEKDMGNLNSRRSYDGEIVSRHKIVNLVYGTSCGIFERENAETAKTLVNGGEYAFES